MEEKSEQKTIKETDARKVEEERVVEILKKAHRQSKVDELVAEKDEQKVEKTEE